MATDYTKFKNGFHYKKAQPAETHVILQVAATGDDADSCLVKNTTAIPNQGEFSTTKLWTDTTGFGVGRFSDAPNGQMAYCNGVDTCIWGGNEMRIAKFIIYDPNGSLSLDYTEQVQNTLTDSENVATLQTTGAGLSGSTMLLLHFEEAALPIIDSSLTTPHTMTAVGNADVSVTQFKYGLQSGIFDGTGDWFRTPHDADFNFSDGTFTIDAWIRLDDVSSEHMICGSQTDSVRYWFLNVIGGASSGQLQFRAYFKPATIWATGVTKVVGDAVTKVTDDGIYYYEVTSISGTGTTGGVEPTWVDTVGSTTTDNPGANQVVWTTRGQININILTGSGRVPITTWTHVAITENAGDFRLFVGGHIEGGSSGNGATVRLSNIVPTTAVPTPLFYLGVKGNGSTTPFKGYIDEFRISNTCLWTADFDPPVAEYSATAEGNLYVGSTRPLGGTDSAGGSAQGIKWYVGTPNTNAATMNILYWSGSAWTSVSNLTDGTVDTATSTKTLNQTGIVGFDSTDGTAKIKVVNNMALYWYKVSIPNLLDTTTVSHMTVYCPFQTVKDVWDGEYEPISSFQFYMNTGGAYNYWDHTTEVLEPSYEYISAADVNPATAVSIDQMEAGTEWLIAGFSTQQMGFAIRMAGTYINTVASALVVKYSDDGSKDVSTWTAVTGLEDGTSIDGKTLAKSGIVSWNPPVSNTEFRSDVAKGFPLYNYAISVTSALSNSIRLYYVGGIPAQQTIKDFKFPMFADDALWLCSDQSDKKNKVIKSAKYAPDVWNGDDYFEVEFGDEKELIASCNLFAQIGSNLYDSKLFFKENALFAVNGVETDKYVVNKISDNIGCNAPLSIATTTVILNQIARPIAIWQSVNGIYIYDYTSPQIISGDIANFFDKRETTVRKLHATYISKSVGYIDEINMEYHWLCADGTSSGLLNREWVCDLLKGFKWYEVDRGSADKWTYVGDFGAGGGVW